MKNSAPAGGKLAADLAVERPIILVLAEGKTDSERNNLRGHLFEKFIAILLELYGYEPPSRSSLNITSNGIELDVVTVHRLNKQKALAECKAYSTNLPASAISSFYGKVSAERLSEPGLTGFFVAIPGLTPGGDEFRRKVSATDKHFHGLVSENIVALLREQRIVVDPPGAEAFRSDLAVLITQYGTYSAAKVLDPNSRLATCVQVWGTEAVPAPVLALVGNSDYAAGLPITGISGPQQQAQQACVSIPVEPTIVEVVGSKSDLEYHLPASPKFFVGRREHMKAFDGLVDGGIDRGVVVVLNGQSGWGKSSLALQFKNIMGHHGGLGAVVDSRTAASPEFVWQSLRKILLGAEKHGLVTLPADASFASLNSTLSTISRASWACRSRPLLVFYDQFENVFRDARLTQEFRDLSLAVRELVAPIIVGFAWKTDLVGLTETYPYQLRDDIRSCAVVYVMEPLGPSEINTLLGRLQRTAETGLQKDLKQRLREVSQGLPWLFKKLASHVAQELKSGTTQEDLVSESLNVKKLFERDLAELGPGEREALKKIARLVPRSASDIVELIPSAVVQSLLDRRLIVRVGDLLDTYWDIFRDFLVSGEVVVGETYILRQTPYAVARLLRETIDAGGDLSVDEAAKRLGLKEGVIFNLSREIRIMGVLTDRPRHVHVSEDILGAANREAAVREKVSASLKKHKAFSVLKEMAAAIDQLLPLANLAEAFPRVFPAIKATKKVWWQYARIFVNWLEYAGLAVRVGDGVEIPPSEPVDFQMLAADRGSRRARRGGRSSTKVFPTCQPRPALQIVEAIARRQPLPSMPPSTQRKALTDLLALGLLSVPKPNVYSVQNNPFDAKFRLLTGVLLAAIEALPGPREAVRLLRRKPSSSNQEVGAVLQAAYGTDWTEQTTELMGKTFRAWAKAAGLSVSRRATAR
jgi:energy-coupling factor transporter ATP-binding protein EcfA2